MGCWNKTCGFSGLPIEVGDPVYVFILEKDKGYYYNDTETTSEYFPFLAPFESVYDDYGGGENSGGVWLPYIMKALKEKLIEVELSDNGFHDISVKREEFNEDLFFKHVHAKRLSISAYDGRSYLSKERIIRFTMMNKSIVDKMLEEFVFKSYDFAVKTGDWEYKFANINSMVEEYWADIKSSWDINKDLSPEFCFFSCDSIIANYLSPYYFSISSELIKIQQLLGECLKFNTNDSITINLIKEYLKGIHVDMMMRSLRKIWIPGSFEGSQSSDYNAYKLMSKITVEHIKKRRRDLLMGQLKTHLMKLS